MSDDKRREEELQRAINERREQLEQQRRQDEIEREIRGNIEQKKISGGDPWPDPKEKKK